MGIIVMALAITTSTYAKLVVLSFGFDNDTQGFTAAIQQNPNGGETCNASTSTSWGSDGTLQITVSAADTCAGASIIIDKLVVLNSTVQRPSTDMVIRDDGGLLTLGGATASLSSIAAPTKLVVLNADGNSGGWSTLSAVWSDSANSGSGDLQMVIPFANASWSTDMVIKFNSVELSTN
jgi:hypothetical protein